MERFETSSDEPFTQTRPKARTSISGQPRRNVLEFGRAK